MSSKDPDAKIEKFDAQLRAAELNGETETAAYAECLGSYAAYLKEKRIRLLDAYNMAARADVIRNRLARMSAEERQVQFDESEKQLETLNENNDEADDPGEYAAFFSDTKDCPFCAETIKMAAIKCKHCGTMLDARHTAAQTSAQPPPQIIRSTIDAGCKGPVVQSGEETEVEEPHRRKRKNQLESGRKHDIGLLIGVLVFFLIITIIAGAKQDRESGSASSESGSPKIGDDGVITKTAIFGSTQANLEQVIRSTMNRDAVGVSDMESAGLAGLLDSGTRVHVIGGGSFASGTIEIRVLTGQYQGRSCFVAFENVARER